MLGLSLGELGEAGVLQHLRALINDLVDRFSVIEALPASFTRSSVFLEELGRWSTMNHHMRHSRDPEIGSKDSVRPLMDMLENRMNICDLDCPDTARHHVR